MWVRNNQAKAFETLINVFANGLSISPDISSKITKLTNDYLELILPGSSEIREKNDKEFIAQSSKTLEEVTKLLSDYKGNKFKF